MPDARVELSTGGRIIGRRKAGSELIFLDLESNGEQLQIMLDNKAMRAGSDFEAVKQTCQRGAIVGVTGIPSRTSAGEFTILASQLTHLAECPHNLPMMNWSHKNTLKDGEKRFS